MQLHYVLYKTPGLKQGERSPCHADDGGVLVGTNHGDVDRTKPGNYEGGRHMVSSSSDQLGTGRPYLPLSFFKNGWPIGSVYYLILVTSLAHKY